MFSEMVWFSFLWLNNILCTLFWLWPSIRNIFYISTQYIYAHAHRHTHTHLWNKTFHEILPLFYAILSDIFNFIFLFLFKYWSLIFRPIIGLQNALKDIKKRLNYYSLLCLQFSLKYPYRRWPEVCHVYPSRNQQDRQHSRRMWWRRG